jgi:hypothetical protein
MKQTTDSGIAQISGFRSLTSGGKAAVFVSLPFVESEVRTQKPEGFRSASACDFVCKRARFDFLIPDF